MASGLEGPFPRSRAPRAGTRARIGVCDDDEDHDNDNDNDNELDNERNPDLDHEFDHAFSNPVLAIAAFIEVFVKELSHWRDLHNVATNEHYREPPAGSKAQLATL